MAVTIEHSLDRAALIDTNTPMAATLGRVASHIDHLRVSYGDIPANWLRCSDIVADPNVVRVLLDQVCALYEMDDRQVAASVLVLGNFWYPLTGAVACYLAEQHVPVVAADAVAIDLRAGAVFTSPYFYALLDEPDAAHPHALIVNDRAQLRARLVRQFDQHHATPLFKTRRAVAPYGLNGMRANYVDRLASAILWLCEQLGEPEVGKDEVTAFVATACEKRRTGVIEIQSKGRSGVYLRRGGCCFNYRLPGSEKCDTCSLRPMNERIALLTQYLLRGMVAH